MVLENLRARFLYKTLDAVLTAPVRPRERGPVYLRRMLSPRSPHYDRVAAFVGWIDKLVPGAARWASSRLLRADSLPFRAGSFQLLDTGSGSTVFLFESEGRRQVVKAYRRTLGRSPGSLVRLATAYRKKYDTVRSWYAGPFDLVHPSSFLVLHGPLLTRPAVACVQSFIEGEKRDFWTGFEDDDLLDLFRQDVAFREQFAFFARRTLSLRASRGLCADFLGAENLMVVLKGDSRALKLIDYGIFELTSLENGSPAIFSRIESLFSRLESLLISAEALGNS